MIPDFKSDGLLPPYSATAVSLDGRSPYVSTMADVVRRLGGTDQRRRLIHGLIRYRAKVREIGLFGAQWICGSFVERHHGKEPNDIDTVTIVNSGRLAAVRDSDLAPLCGPAAKAIFGVDAYFVRVDTTDTYRAMLLYWSGLFAHSRQDVWKGIIELPLGIDDADQDAHAATLLDGEDLERP